MTDRVTIQQLTTAEIIRIAEIDRSEHVALHYAVKDGALQAEEVDWQIPPWSREGTGRHSVAAKVAAWRPLLEDGAVLLGAMDGDRLAGIAILRCGLTPSVAQLAALFVSRAYRQQGVGRALVQEVIRRAREDGALTVYVSATPTGSAVGFYHTQGFALTSHPHPELYEQEPEDIHMVMSLD